MKRLLCLLLLLLSHLSLHAGQQRLEIDTAFFHDVQQQHTLETIASQAFTPYRGQLRLGFAEGDTWLRLSLKNPQPSPADGRVSPLVLRVEPYFLDKLTFYQHSAGKWTQQQGGELRWPLKNICFDLQHCFEFSASHADAQFAYLKVETSGVRIVRTDVMTDEDMMKSSIAVLKSITTALNLSIGLLMVSVAFYCFERSRLLLAFCGFQTTVVWSICAFSGVLPTWWGLMTEVSPNVMTGLAQVMRMAMTFLLAWVVVATYKPIEAYNRWVAAGLLACAINVLLVLGGQETEAAILNYGLGFFIPLIQIWGARTVREPMPGRWVFTTGWLIFFLFKIGRAHV